MACPLVGLAVTHSLVVKTERALDASSLLSHQHISHIDLYRTSLHSDIPSLITQAMIEQ